MLAKARANQASHRKSTGLDNVEFRLGEIEHLPVSDHSVDVVISNCVLNLSPDKPQVWSEIARVLKPGGRVAVSDLALLKPLPSEVAQMIEALVGCVAGAVLMSETERMARDAGFTDIVLDPEPTYIAAMTGFEDPIYQKIIAHLPEGSTPADYITSLEIRARKPASSIFSPAVAELVAIGAAVAANCEPCLKHHYDQANKLGISKSDMAMAVKMAAAVKDAPHQSILRLADRLTGQERVQAFDPLDLRLPAKTSTCCESSGADSSTGKCC
jgi:AhpD family alkylhydroperoxidase